VKTTVLMVTGAYFPELSGGGLQARAVVRALARDVNFSVLTTSTDRALPQRAMEDGIPIRRLYVDLASAASRLTAAFRLALAFMASAWRVDVVNLHGFSRKAILLVALSRVLRKRFILTLQTGVQDEPAAVRASGRLAYWAYRNVDLYLSVSPGLTRAYLDAGLPAQRLRQLCNAVDVERFTPAAPEERRRLRGELALPQDVPLVLFVGVFSRDKRPDLLYRAWAQSAAAGLGGSVVLIGATRPINPDIDAALADAIRAQAIEDGLAQRVVFVESSHEIDKYFRAVDVYVLPSVREGLPIALLEAMSSGLPCVATHLSGSTDVLIEDGTNGLLVAPDNLDEFAGAITRLVQDRELAARLGAAARRTVVDRYSIQATAAAWLAAYNDVAAAAGLATPARGTT
jgi:glycosyltransferase involved in cell wall biosynthesis